MNYYVNCPNLPAYARFSPSNSTIRDGKILSEYFCKAWGRAWLYNFIFNEIL